jgi:hypothetical protein
LLGFDGKQARLTGLATGLQGRHLRQQVLLPLFPDHDLLFSHLVARAHLAEPFAALCSQSVQMSNALLQDRPSFDQFRVPHWLFRISMIRIQVERNEPISDRILLTSPSPEVRLG